MIVAEKVTIHLSIMRGMENDANKHLAVYS